MAKYILKRLLYSIPILLGVSLIIFVMLNVVPGDPVALMFGEHVYPEVIERVRAEMHLDDPAYIRYFRFVWDALHGNFGISYKMNRPVTYLLLTAFPRTLILALSAAFISWIVGIPAGILSAVKQYSIEDYAFMGFAFLGVSMPVFWSALLFQYIFALKLGWLPVAGYAGAKYYIMPAIVLGWSSVGIIARLTRSSLLEVMRNDYIRTARAKGLKELPILFSHALKNSILPVITVMATQVASLLSGAIITESVFAIPGIGRIAVGAIQSRDMPLLQGAVIFATFLVIIGNIIADVSYGFVDPRIRYD